MILLYDLDEMPSLCIGARGVMTGVGIKRMLFGFVIGSSENAAISALSSLASVCARKSFTSTSLVAAPLRYNPWSEIFRLGDFGPGGLSSGALDPRFLGLRGSLIAWNPDLMGDFFLQEPNDANALVNEGLTLMNGGRC